MHISARRNVRTEDVPCALGAMMVSSPMIAAPVTFLLSFQKPYFVVVRFLGVCDVMRMNEGSPFRCCLFLKGKMKGERRKATFYEKNLSNF